ncbi:MAG: GDYXXLXY domain-containing protein [Campylobacteraceae bacterium]|jgi:uncharacterized membrane-anchored protein|nr:GDYXXLXY domain-containing protein [Campylobacteraceae bacterium]
MKRAKLFWGALILFMAVQLCIVLWQAIKYGSIIYFGKTLYLAVEPFDPYDAFRGRYIRLNFADNYIKAEGIGKEFFVTFTTNDDGISKPHKVFNSKPDADEAYLKIKSYRSVWYDDGIYISYPFERFYMQEDLAIEVDANRDIFDVDNKPLAVVKVLDGVGVLSDVMINGTSISKYVQNLREQNPSLQTR